MINQEEIYQLIYKEDWLSIIALLHSNRNQILHDSLLTHAAATFENVFFPKVSEIPVDDKSIRDILSLMYVLDHGKFYTLRAENYRTLIFEIVKRNPIKIAYDYALEFPDEPICKKVIDEYNQEKPAESPDLLSIGPLPPIRWTEICNRLFELINDSSDTATYFSGPRFITAVQKSQPYFSNYYQYIELRNQQGKSTSRKIFYYDILMSFDEKPRAVIVKDILNVVRPFKPIQVNAIEALLKGISDINTHVEPIHALQENSNSPVIFISYSWDDEIHKKWVLELAEKLRANGVDVILDRYEIRAGTNLPHFVERSIQRASRIVIVFTPNYKLKADKRTGGVGYEYSIMNADLYKNQTTNEKIIPILRAGNIDDSIPTFMQQFIHIDFSRDENFETSTTDLLREIFNEPAIKKPVLGPRPNFLT